MQLVIFFGAWVAVSLVGGVAFSVALIERRSGN
jgi:hypothetical protein